MSEPVPEGGGGPAAGSFMSRKFLGIPAIFWLLGAAVLAYLYFRHQSSTASGGGATSTSGSGQSTTGDITFQPAAETIDVQGQYGPNTQSGSDTTVTGGGPGSTTTGGSSSGGGDTDQGGPGNRTPNPQPQPRPKPPTKVNAKSMRTYTVKKGETLPMLAKRFGISVACLAHHNVYVTGEVPGNSKVGQPLGTGAGLRTGQVLKIPSPGDC